MYNKQSAPKQGSDILQKILRMKSIQLLISTFFIVSLASAQLLKPTQASPSFAVNFEKIVQDYRNNFNGIQGERVPSETEKEVFKSTMTVPGSLHAVIYRFHSKKDQSASWQAILFTGESQQAALRTYKSTCRQIRNFRVAGVGMFKGDYREPDANLRFAGSSFKMESTDKIYDQFFAEVELVMDEEEQWEVHLNLVRKKEDDSMY